MELSFPVEFDFYHLGKIQRAESHQPSGADAVLIPPHHEPMGLTFHGDFTGVLILWVREGLDFSMYAEVGNIIASQIATQLASRHAVDCVISPPQRLKESQLRTLLSAFPIRHSQTYTHTLEGEVVRLPALFLGAQEQSPDQFKEEISYVQSSRLDL